MLLPPTEHCLGEAYLRDDFDIEGDLEAATALTGTIAKRVRHPGAALGLLVRLQRLRDEPAAPDATTVRRAYCEPGVRHSQGRDAAAIRYHYDVGNDFYRLWLDRRMVYSCAYFPNGHEDLDAAQEAKLDLICRKLRLRPGERLLDIGCGWGALVLHAAERYGVEATGVTISREQAALARERIAAAGLADRCRIELRDYRDLPATEFDKMASVGMVEHVGRAMLPTYFHHAFRLLAPGGLFLNHGIVALEPAASAPPRWLSQRIGRWRSFIETYVFPDGELVAPADVLAPATTAGFELRDVESLREHYARTLRHWVRRLEVRHDEAVAMVGEPTYRVWRTYMAGCAHAFAAGRIGVIQTLLAKRDANGAVQLPNTRADLYT
jgi:cyclopropane-fatty-acyl-phospholipid synthase